MMRSPSPATPQASQHLIQYLRVLSKRRYTALLTLLLVVGTVAFVTARAVPQYMARAQVMIEVERPRAGDLHQPQPERRRAGLVEPQFVERLQHVEPRLANLPASPADGAGAMPALPPEPVSPTRTERLPVGTVPLAMPEAFRLVSAATLPLNAVAVTVPAEKLPEASRLTMAEAVFALFAALARVTPAAALAADIPPTVATVVAAEPALLVTSPLKAGSRAAARVPVLSAAASVVVGAVAQVPSALRNLPAAASPAAGAGTAPLVPPAPLSPTTAGRFSAGMVPLAKNTRYETRNTKYESR